MKYIKESISKIINQALQLLQRNDYLLFQVNSSERSISHRLAIYLDDRFKGYDVDCEYNRRMYEPKIIKNFWDKIKNSSLETKVYPDIIVHKRKTHENLLVIEIKKSSASQKEKDFDHIKSKAYMSKGDEYQYKYGIYIEFPMNKNFVNDAIKEFYKDESKIHINSKYFGKF